MPRLKAKPAPAAEGQSSASICHETLGKAFTQCPLLAESSLSLATARVELGRPNWQARSIAWRHAPKFAVKLSSASRANAPVNRCIFE
jgi:hypothetical protein